MDVLIFEIAGVRYALPTSDVSELTPAVTIAPLPKAPPIVEGIINVHGRVVPVLDIRARFGLPSRPLSHTDHLIVARVGPRLVAVRADRALGLVRVDTDHVEDAQTFAPGTEYISGVAKLADGLVLIHDFRSFLHEAEAIVLDEAVSEIESPGGAT